jgi:ribose transport system permease protein
MLLAVLIGVASQMAGNGYSLTGIAAVVGGGTMLDGGRGSTVASAVAALFMAQLDQLMLALDPGLADQLLV